ncbi:MAG TPA: phosphoethanolamine--lipid A transferase [Burkholderiales bacterium]|nr:phosphoethanolamine--lipid A transferase [Burkholderiales bacterium]
MPLEPLRRLRRVNSLQAGFAVSLWLVAFCNVAFWRIVWKAVSADGAQGVVFMASGFVVAVLFVNAFVCLVVLPRAGKPLLILLLLVSAVAAHFMDSYGAVLDHEMIRNVFETDTREAAELLSWKLAAYVAILGVLPSAWVAWADIRFRPWWREVLARAAMLGVSAVCMSAILYAGYRDYASLLRNHMELKHVLNPTGYLGSLRWYVAHKYAPAPPLVRIGEDARRGPAWAGMQRRTATVIVIGETARAANFSLGGYGRDTNPQLARRDVLYFTDVTACGTSTAASLPCMFSDLGRAGRDDGREAHRENLLDVLARSGFAVKWRDNNSGCKGVCARTGMEDVSVRKDAELCPHECYDAVLLEGLPQLLRGADGDLVLVLHQKGSHGPSYYLRYPRQYEVFKPVCRTNQLETCTPDEIVNAYDDSILYTDRFLAQAIDLLKAQDGLDTALLYVSDHGESLGEGGVYLHGLPWSLAPKAQKRVPMLLWMSDGFRARFGLDRACLHGRTRQPWSHDNLFHSVLGMLDVRTAAYRAELDLFHGCRPG